MVCDKNSLGVPEDKQYSPADLPLMRPGWAEEGIKNDFSSMLEGQDMRSGRENRSRSVNSKT